MKIGDSIQAQRLGIGCYVSKLSSRIGVRQIPQRTHRGERGLTTLEWLLIVAAVAGLAALAVVLVQNVVDDTAEEITGNNARITAAKVAANRINSDAIDEIVQKANTGDNDDAAPSNASDLVAIANEYKSKCERLEITYSDAQITANWDTIVLAAEYTWTSKSAIRSGLQTHQASNAAHKCNITTSNS